jgi:(p)ppGpp synthase/HD superfamily hydrolase
LSGHTTVEQPARPGGEINVSTLERAIAIAAEAHAGQVDKAGAPYVLHPLRMMLRVTSNDERVVAVLHDVCEDCPGWTLDRLRAEGFPDHVIDALRSVTKRDGEDYEGFVRRAAANPIGRRVKLADLEDNCDLSRIAAPTQRDFERIEKYQRAIELIRRSEG